MQGAQLDWSICQVCSPCLARLECTTRAIVQIDLDEPPYIEPARCSRCGKCVSACPFSAITMKNGNVPGLSK